MKNCQVEQKQAMGPQKKIIMQQKVCGMHLNQHRNQQHAESHLPP